MSAVDSKFKEHKYMMITVIISGNWMLVVDTSAAPLLCVQVYACAPQDCQLGWQSPLPQSEYPGLRPQYRAPLWLRSGRSSSITECPPTWRVYPTQSDQTTEI